MTRTVEQLIASARAAAASARTIDRNRRLGRYQGRNSAATDEWYHRLVAQMHSDQADLVALGGDARLAAGWIKAEDDLARRVSEARDQGQPRPELRARLTGARRTLRIIAQGDRIERGLAAR
jgi:hypothetical protein